MDCYDRIKDLCDKNGIAVTALETKLGFGRDAIGIPDVYIIERGGWSSDYVMKRIYRDAPDEEKKKQTDAINDHFGALVK